MIKLEIKDGLVYIDSKPYPPTQHNLNIWNEYKRTLNEEVLKALSEVSLDI